MHKSAFAAGALFLCAYGQLNFYCHTLLGLVRLGGRLLPGAEGNGRP